jgi:hypothetical protein
VSGNISKEPPQWKVYETQIAQLVAALDVNAEVTHNKQVEAKLSKVMRVRSTYGCVVPQLVKVYQ